MILHVDSRQKIYHKEFGDISSDVPAERLFTYQNIIEDIGAVTCVAISGCKARSSQTGREYDYQSSYNFAPHNANGMYPPDWFSSVVKRGLQYLNSVLFDTDIKSYWRVDTDGSGDRFDNTITAAQHANSAVTVWTNFYANWLTCTSDVLPQGDNVITEHDWVIAGWKVVNGITMLIVDFHTGRTYDVSREIFNLEVSRMGCGTGIPATPAIEAIQSRDFFTFVSDIIKNLWLQITSIQQQINTMPIVNQSKNNSQVIVKWANLIKKYEGADPALHNPGNFKYSTLLGTWGGQKSGTPGSDGGYFCKFPDDKTGFQALCNFLTLGAENQLISYHVPHPDHPDVNPRTIKGFILVYTNFPQPQYDYSDNLIKDLGVSADTNINTFLT